MRTTKHKYPQTNYTNLDPPSIPTPLPPMHSPIATLHLCSTPLHTQTQCNSDMHTSIQHQLQPPHVAKSKAPTTFTSQKPWPMKPKATLPGTHSPHSPRAPLVLASHTTINQQIHNSCLRILPVVSSPQISCSSQSCQQLPHTTHYQPPVHRQRNHA